MPIPADVSTANIDSETDDPRLWRADGLDLTQKFNETLAYLRAKESGIFVITDYGAKGDGVTDDTAAIAGAIAAAQSTGGIIFAPAREYLIGEDLTIPDDVTVLFAQGAKFKIGTDVTLTWNGGIMAGPYQQIFSGDLVQSGFMSGVTPPYVFGVQGDPKCEWTSPFWFGAVGDDVANDAEAIDCVLYFGSNIYFPAATYLTNKDHAAKRSNVRIFGDGAASKIHGTSGTSALMAFSGVDVGIQRNNIIENLAFDAGDVAAYNGFGLTYVEDCIVRNLWLENCGHYAVTLQYYCKRNIIENITVVDAASSPSSTRSVISLEGTDAVFDDVDGNIIRNVICQTSGNNGIIVHNVSGKNTIENVWIETIAGDAAAGGGVLLRLRDTVQNCVIRNVRAGAATGRLIAADAGASDNVLEDIGCGAISNTAGAAYAKIATVAGARNAIRGLKAASGDTDGGYGVEVSGSENRFYGLDIECAMTGPALLLSGDDNEIHSPRIVGTAATSYTVNVTGNRNKIHGGRVEAPNATVKGIRLSGTGNEVIGATVTGDGAGRIRVETTASRSVVTGNIYTGTGASTEVFLGAASSSAIHDNVNDAQTLSQFVRLGAYALWVDATGVLRIYNGNPPTDTSGTVVGTQT